MKTDRIETVTENTFVSGEKIFPVAAFSSPGYVTSYAIAYEEEKDAGMFVFFIWSSRMAKVPSGPLQFWWTGRNGRIYNI